MGTSIVTIEFSHFGSCFVVEREGIVGNGSAFCYEKENGPWYVLEVI